MDRDIRGGLLRVWVMIQRIPIEQDDISAIAPIAFVVVALCAAIVAILTVVLRS
jgi:hypothetical protein